MHDDLQPIGPEQAKEMYLTERRTDLAPETLENHDYTLRRFVEWCAADGIANLNELTGRNLHEFRQQRADDGLTQSSLKCQLVTVRTFIEFCESIDAVSAGLHEKMLVPRDPGSARDEKIDRERVERVLEYWRPTSTQAAQARPPLAAFVLHLLTYILDSSLGACEM